MWLAAFRVPQPLINSKPFTMPQKLYCYVDETGLDIQAQWFIVATVVIEDDPSLALTLCETIERDTGKNRVKWIRTDYPRRLVYIERLIREVAFKGRLYVAAFRKPVDYNAQTLETIAWTMKAHTTAPYRVTILIDGLPRQQEQAIGRDLVRLGVAKRKVRGIRYEEYDALSRLADAVCGWTRAALEGQPGMIKLYDQAKATGWLTERQP